MIAPWMLYCVLCALGLSLAAVVAEQTLLAARVPVRHVWTVAVLLSLAVPALAYRVASQPTVTVAAASDERVAVPVVSGDSLAPASPALTISAQPATPRWAWRTALARADVPLGIAWLTLSSALIAHFLCGTIALAWMRRWWRRDTVQGVEVLVSEATGPALVGALSPAIVVPQWTLDMEASQVELMLRHEQEHRRARDGQLLTLAHFALIAMPWNVALWWQLVRLRVAVELDCDARVLRDADARSYGDLLLEVARPRRRLALMGATAFAERASQLERRIRAIGQRRGRASHRTGLVVAGIGLVVVTAAWIAPHPAAPPRASHSVTPSPTTKSTPRDSTVVPRQTQAVAQASTTPAKTTTLNGTASKPSQPLHVAADSARTSELVSSQKKLKDSAAPSETLPRRELPGPVVTRPIGLAELPVQIGTDSTFARLFGGITLTPDQETKARALIAQLEAAQVEQMSNTLRALMAAAPLRQAVQAHADSTLENLLTNDADKALLHSRFVAQVPGGRGRSGGGAGGGGTVGAGAVARGGFAGDSLFIGGGGRGARVGGGGRGAASVVTGDVVVDGGRGVAPVVTGAIAVEGGRGGGRGGAGGLTEVNATDFLFQRYFNGIALTPQQEGDARTILTKMQADMRALGPPVAPAIMSRPPFSNQVVMSQESAAAFAAILTNDADRATLASRIRIQVVRTLEVPPR
ncbi:MAG TPA: M56 family metallopeptidase [Gemmatimonadaceae bacterium]|nr:M56 family metallopeptidase [Gemmatimonadaceae bacterium]